MKYRALKVSVRFWHRPLQQKKTYCMKPFPVSLLLPPVFPSLSSLFFPTFKPPSFSPCGRALERGREVGGLVLLPFPYPPAPLLEGRHGRGGGRGDLVERVILVVGVDSWQKK